MSLLSRGKGLGAVRLESLIFLIIALTYIKLQKNPEGKNLGYFPSCDFLLFFRVSFIRENETLITNAQVNVFCGKGGGS